MPGLADLVDEQTAWMSDAACLDSDPEMWFSFDPRDRTYAKWICANCPVRIDCLTYAVRNREHEGIWGGKEGHELVGFYRDLRSVG